MSAFPPISELVPHLEPMLALEELLEWSEEHAVASLEVRAQNLFVRDGRLEGACILEFLAQTVAACQGLLAFRAGAGAQVGMVVACRELVLERPWLGVGERLTLSARRVRGDGHASVFETEARGGSGELVARATLTLVHGPTPA